MALDTQSPRASQTPHAPRKIWAAPTSSARWLWLTGSVLLVLIAGGIYLIALKTQAFPGPFSDPLRSLGILAFLMVLATAAYSLRRRFARGLPGKVQNWLWMHTWLGLAALLIALFHENFTHVLHDYCANASCLTEADGGTSALFALIILVLSGLAGRLIDTWQARIIAREASTNGTGIMRAVEERRLELEYTVERLSAGKSEDFKQYCLQALEGNSTLPLPARLPAGEEIDFKRAQETLHTYGSLTRSLHQQERARRLIRLWRRFHIIIAILALLVITFHAGLELCTNVFHLITP